MSDTFCFEGGELVHSIVRRLSTVPIESFWVHFQLEVWIYFSEFYFFVFIMIVLILMFPHSMFTFNLYYAIGKPL